MNSLYTMIGSYRKKSIIYIVLSTIVFAFAKVIGVVPFVLSLIYYIKINNIDKVNANTVGKIEKWIVVMLIISAISIVLVASILGKTAFRALN